MTQGTPLLDSLQADKGPEWQWCDLSESYSRTGADEYRQAMHDRDRFQRERDYEREQRT